MFLTPFLTADANWCLEMEGILAVINSIHPGAIINWYTKACNMNHSIPSISIMPEPN